MLASSDTDALELLPDSIWNKVAIIDGWHLRSAAEVTWTIIRDQIRTMPAFNALELGVFKGKYLALINAASRGAIGYIIGVDALYTSVGVMLDKSNAVQWINNVHSAVFSVGGESSRFRFVRSETAILDREKLKRDYLPLQFISVDAGHDYENALHDMALAQDLLAPDGVIAADDVYNFNCPGVMEAIFDHMKTERGKALAPFAFAGNKLFICRRSQHARYFNLMERFVALDTEIGRATRELRNSYATLGYRPVLFGAEMVTIPV